MKKYRCQECDEVFTLEEAGTVREYVGEFWGAPSYNDLIACPRCSCTELITFTECGDDEDD